LSDGDTKDIGRRAGMSNIVVHAVISLAQIETITAAGVQKEPISTPDEVKRRIVQFMDEGYALVSTDGDSYTLKKEQVVRSWISVNKALF
jgi:hypothetical protein